VVSPVQAQLEEALQADPGLSPLAVRVVNLSYWYYQRRKLGAVKHMHHGARFDRKKGAWEAYIYVHRLK
jgi:hypothetical protein